MRSRLQTFLSIVAVILVTIFFHYLGWLSPIEEGVQNLLSPSLKQVYSWSVSDVDTELVFHSVEDLEKAYLNLLDERKNWKSDQVKLRLAEEENSILREQLSFLNDQTYQHVGADVIAGNLDPIGNTIVLNVGSRFGVTEGNPVIAGNGILVGIVVRVERDISIVRMLSDAQSRVGATLLEEKRSIGIIEGGFGISVRMNFIPQNEAIEIDDTIITSGLEETIPYGLFIGTVETVDKEPYKPFQQAVVRPAVDYDQLRTVSVIISQETVSI